MSSLVRDPARPFDAICGIKRPQTIYIDDVALDVACGSSLLAAPLRGKVSVSLSESELI